MNRPLRSFTNARFHSMVLLAVSSCALFVLIACGSGSSGGNNAGGGGNQPSPSTPTITAISPKSAVAGGAAFTLTINGTNFVAASMANFGGSAPATTFVSATQLTAAIPAGSIGSTGTMAVTVTNPAPGGTSNTVNFTINGVFNPAPTITSFYPSCAPAG